MKRVMFVAILLVASVGVSAAPRPNPYLNRRQANLGDNQRLCVRNASFEEIVQGAKAGDANSLYFLALAVAKGEEVDQSGTLAFKYLQQSADAGNSNALFLVHMLMERATTGGHPRKFVNFYRYAGVNINGFSCTNKIVSGEYKSTDSNAVKRILALYEADERNGVFAATDEIARVRSAFSSSVSAEADREDEIIRRNSNTRLLGAQLGDKIEQQKEYQGIASMRERRARRERARLASLQRVQRDRESRILMELIPFPEAARKAKDGDGVGMYAVALHYAKGHEITRDEYKAGKYLKMAADKNNAYAVLISSLVMESSMTIPQPRIVEGPSSLTDLINFGDDNKGPDCAQYTGGVGAWNFRSSSFGGLSVTNAEDVAKIEDGYKKAFSLGVLYATNELARFERRVAAITAGIEKRNAEIKAHIENLQRNARLAQELLGEVPGIVALEREREKEREKQRAQLLAIQEELRKARAERDRIKRTDNRK